VGGQNIIRVVRILYRWSEYYPGGQNIIRVSEYYPDGQNFIRVSEYYPGVRILSGWSEYYPGVRILSWCQNIIRVVRILSGCQNIIRVVRILSGCQNIIRVSEYYPGGQINKNGTGAACGMLGENIGNWSVWWGYLRERDYWKDLRVDGEIILKLNLKKFIGKLWTRFVLVQIWGKL
jgi:hypothetical protein